MFTDLVYYKEKHVLLGLTGLHVYLHEFKIDLQTLDLD